MEQEIHITLRFNLATGKVGLNEIIYKLKERQYPLMLKILDEILKGYDNLISEHLSRTDQYLSKPRFLFALLARCLAHESSSGKDV